MKHFYGHIQGDAKNEGRASASKNGSLQEIGRAHV